MNLMVLRFGHLIAPFKEGIFFLNRKMHYNLVKLLSHLKNSKKENKKSNSSISHN